MLSCVQICAINQIKHIEVEFIHQKLAQKGHKHAGAHFIGVHDNPDTYHKSHTHRCRDAFEGNLSGNHDHNS
jgi:hypothetical protein